MSVDKFGIIAGFSLYSSPRAVDDTYPTLAEALAGALDHISADCDSVSVCSILVTEEGEPYEDQQLFEVTATEAYLKLADDD